MTSAIRGSVAVTSELRRGGAPSVHWVNQFAVTPDQPGGTRHHDMAIVLRSRGYDVRVIASDLNLMSRRYTRRKDGADRRVIEQDVAGVPYTWLPAGGYRSNDWRRAASMVVFAGHVLCYLLRRARRGDVVIGSSPQLPVALAARVAALLRGATFVLEIRDLWPESLNGVSGRRSVLAVVLRLFADALYRTSSAIIILAEGSREPIIRHGGPSRRIIFVPNGVDLDAFSRPVRELPASLRWVEEHPTFVYAGAHGPANGLELVLDAAALLRTRGSEDIRLLLVGDGPVKQQLQMDAHRRGLTNVVFHDPIPKELIPSLLRRCTGGLMVLKDVELFRYAVSPNKLFDYLASELPVVTNVGGEVARIVEQAQAGVVVSPRDAAGLATAMQLLSGGDFGAAHGSAYVREHHDRRRLASQLARVIDAVSGA